MHRNRHSQRPRAADVTNSMTGQFRPDSATVGQDWPRVAEWLAGQGLVLDVGVPARQFAGGVANLNYLVVADGQPAVFRRPPDGPVAEGASDMAREHRVLHRLAARYPLAPRSIAFCDDPGVIGAPFQLIDYRPGVAVGDRLPTDVADRADAGDVLTGALLSAMADLHRLDPADVGLGDLGRPDGFLGRQVEGWARRAAAAYDGHPPPEVDVVVSHLRRHVPPESSVALLHGDLKFDNLLVDLHRLEAVAVVDWDMATRGDPLFDLAVLLSYWIEPQDPVDVHGLRQVPSLEPGFPSRADVAERYFAAVGRPPVDLRFHLALARFRLAIAWRQLFRLYRQGAFGDDRYAAFDGLAQSILRWTADSLRS